MEAKNIGFCKEGKTNPKRGYSNFISKEKPKKPAPGKATGVYLIFLYALISPLVDESCSCTSPSFSSSGNILPASCLPSSTPHWSKLKMFQITPWTKILCS